MDKELVNVAGDSGVGRRLIEPQLVKAGYCKLVWHALGAGRSDKPAGAHHAIEAHAEWLVGLLWGQEDRLAPVAQGKRLANEIPGARLVVLPAVGHSPHLEAPNAVIEHLLPFLTNK